MHLPELSFRSQTGRSIPANFCPIEFRVKIIRPRRSETINLSNRRSQGNFLLDLSYLFLLIVQEIRKVTYCPHYWSDYNHVWVYEGYRYPVLDLRLCILQPVLNTPWFVVEIICVEKKRIRSQERSDNEIYDPTAAQLCIKTMTSSIKKLQAGE